MTTIFEAGGKQYELIYTINSLCAFENKFEIGVLEALSDKKQFANLRGLFWAGLIELNNDISVEDAGKILDTYVKEDDNNTVFSATKIITEALKGSGFFGRTGKKAQTETKSAK